MAEILTLIKRFLAAFELRKAKSIAVWSTKSLLVASWSRTSKAVSSWEGPWGAIWGEDEVDVIFGDPGTGVRVLIKGICNVQNRWNNWSSLVIILKERRVIINTIHPLWVVFLQIVELLFELSSLFLHALLIYAFEQTSVAPIEISIPRTLLGT